jgi:hypothetical protein
MKTPLFLIAFMACIHFVNAQKVDLDKKVFSFKYRDLPGIVLPKEFRTYSVQVDAPGSIRNTFSDLTITNSIRIHGWKKIADGVGHMIVRLKFEDVVFRQANVIETVDEKKDKEGKIIERKYYYSVEAPYVWSGAYSALTFKDSVILREPFGVEEKWVSRAFSSSKEASEFWSNNRESIKNDLVREKVKAKLDEWGYRITSIFGFTPKMDYDWLWIVGAKKHPEYEAQKNAMLEFQSAIQKCDENVLPDDSRGKLLEILEYFLMIPERYPTDEKTDKKMRYASYFNRAKIYLYLDAPDLALIETEKLVNNDYDIKDGRRIAEDANALSREFKRNKMTSRHFFIDEAQFEGPF